MLILKKKKKLKVYVDFNMTTILYMFTFNEWEMEPV